MEAVRSIYKDQHTSISILQISKDNMYAIFIFLIVYGYWAGHADCLLKCGSDSRGADQLAGLVYVCFTAFWKGKNSIIRQTYLNFITFLVN
jgi:hypothetical protein